MVKKLVVLVTTTLAASGALGFAAGAASAVVLPLPFRATVAGTAVQTSASTGTFAGQGYATYMGRVTNNGGVLATFVPSNICPNGFSSVNTERFTSANGGTLSIKSQDVTCPVGPNQYQGSGEWTVTAGTGIYKGATGQGTYSGFADFNVQTQTFNFKFTGAVALINV